MHALHRGSKPRTANKFFKLSSYLKYVDQHWSVKFWMTQILASKLNFGWIGSTIFVKYCELFTLLGKQLQGWNYQVFLPRPGDSGQVDQGRAGLDEQFEILPLCNLGNRCMLQQPVTPTTQSNWEKLSQLHHIMCHEPFTISLHKGTKLNLKKMNEFKDHGPFIVLIIAQRVHQLVYYKRVGSFEIASSIGPLSADVQGWCQ